MVLFRSWRSKRQKRTGLALHQLYHCFQDPQAPAPQCGLDHLPSRAGGGSRRGLQLPELGYTPRRAFAQGAFPQPNSCSRIIHGLSIERRHVSATGCVRACWVARLSNLWLLTLIYVLPSVVFTNILEGSFHTLLLEQRVMYGILFPDVYQQHSIICPLLAYLGTKWLTDGIYTSISERGKVKQS